MNEFPLSNPENIKKLANIFKQSSKVNQLNKEYSDFQENPEGWTIAQALADIEESLAKIYENILPHLFSDGLSDKSITDALLNIGEEFRHILYHINDSKFFQYLSPISLKST